ncbi:proline synthetase associated protein, putative, partial [Perkinsus marinus ATCC 50983]
MISIKMDMLMEAYEKCGPEAFWGELRARVDEKAKEMPQDIQWHMIGHLQRNKVAPLLKAVPHLYAVESVDSIKLADKLNAAAATAMDEGLRSDPLNVFIEVMTSDEITKTGIEKDEDIDALAEHIATHCQGLKLFGLMTVANPDLAVARENFERLAAIGERVYAHACKLMISN